MSGGESIDVAAVAAMVEQRQRPDVLHLCGELREVSAPEIERLRALIGDTQFMQAIAVTGAEAVRQAVQLAAVVDALILDSYSGRSAGSAPWGRSTTGRSAPRSSKAVDVSVILAGGLKPENVAEAIETASRGGATH